VHIEPIILGVRSKVLTYKKIMAKSDDLFGVGGTLRQKLLQHTSHPDKVVIVNKVCDDVGLAFKLWDGAFSAIHSPNPTVEH